MKHSGLFSFMGLLAVVAYILSPPLALKFMMAFPHLKMVGKGLILLYAPLKFLEHSDTYTNVLAWECRFFGIYFGD